MAQSKSFKLRQADNRPNYYDGALPEIDRKRATAALVRQSKTGADTAQAESRETQLGLQNYGRLLIATTSRMYGCMMKAPEYPGKNALTSERYSTVFIRTCTGG